MKTFGKQPFENIGEMQNAQETIENEFEDTLTELSNKYGRENVVMALEGYAFDIRHRNTLNTYDIPDNIFEDLMHIKQEYDIEIDVSDVDIEEFVFQATIGNPLMLSVHQWPDVETWEKQWDNLQELHNEYGSIIYEVFFDLVVHTTDGYHARQPYINAIMDEIV